MDIIRSYLTENDCYRAGRTIRPRGIVVHDTGCNQRRVAPYLSSWNRSGVTTCVHAFIGIRPDGSFGVVQTLPWTCRPWGCGKGSKGSYNNSHIQFELCEDDHTDADWMKRCWDKAVELCVWLCRSYDISPDCIVDHAEAHSAGYASNHADTGDWFPRFGKDMDDFRAAVRAKLNQSAGDFTPYPVRVTADRLNVRSGPGTDYGVRRTVKRGEVYTIVARQDGWGRLKSGAGWVCLAYTMRI